jgi:hypothetical protein
VCVATGNATRAEVEKTCMLIGGYVAETRGQIDEFKRVRRTATDRRDAVSPHEGSLHSANTLMNSMRLPGRAGS